MRKIYFFLLLLFALTTISTKSYAYNFTTHTEHDSCNSGFTFYATINAANTNLKIFTYFGDGDTATGYISATTCYNWHNYTSLGTYTVKHILKLSGVPVDSIQFTISLGCQMAYFRMYNDNNSNCLLDAGDNYVYNQGQIEIDSSGVKIDTVSITGVATKALTIGATYSFKLLAPPLGSSFACPTSGIITKTMTSSSTYTYIDFGVICSSTTAFDLSLTLSARYRPVSTSRIYIYARNKGCGYKNGTVTVTLSPKYTYSSSSITPTSVSGSTITWNVINLNYFNYQFIALYVTPTTTVSLGDTICTSATITPTTGDVYPADNYASRCDSVVSSFDPNEKDVMPKGPIAAGTKLTYTLNFENLGNDTAFNIHILDTLSYGLDPNSLQVLSSSHAVSSNVYAVTASTNVVRFDFANIKLPYTTSPNFNKGFVTFSINSKGTMGSGYNITNRAGIYFDINPVVMTNTVENKIAQNGAVNVVEKLNQPNVYPNPTNDIFYVNLNGNYYNQLEIVNNLGQVLVHKNVDGNTTSVSTKQLIPGIYQLVLKGDSGVKVMKVEKQ